MVVLIGVGLPEEAEKWELELFSSVFPVVIQYLPELLGVVHLEDILVLFVEVVHHPALALWQIHAFSSHHLHLDDRLL